MQSDRDALLWMWQAGAPICVALTKIDTTSQLDVAQRKREILGAADNVPVVSTSAKKGNGISDLVKVIAEATKAE